MAVFSFSKSRVDVQFGPPYAVINLSKVGLRYFRLLLNTSAVSRSRLVEQLKDHPNVGWMLTAEGWFSLGIGLWARDNAEINDISSQIREMLGDDDEIVYQSELTSLLSFGTTKHRSMEPMSIVDATVHPVELTPLELDYLKLITLDNSMSCDSLASILAIDERAVTEMYEKLKEEGVIVGEQERINYSGYYYKVFVDTSSANTKFKFNDFLQKLWQDPLCIYVERANGKYDLEFELVLNARSDIKAYTKQFSETKVALLKDNLYTNLYPLSKIVNLKTIQDTLALQEGDVIDFRNSKLWYLNYRGAAAYLGIYENREYFEVMEKSELDLFDDIAVYLKDVAKNVSLIDIGSGNGEKARIFIEKMGEKNVKAYYPVDIQPIELAEALAAHKQGSYAKHPTLLDFENLSARFPLKLLPGEHQVYAFLGGTYGNYPSSVINQRLRSVLSDTSVLLVAMPIIEATTDETIIRSYANSKVEAMAFGPLEQMGFQKESFEINSQFPELRVQLGIDNRRLTSSFILKEDAAVLDRTFKKGTTFLFTTSWKPTLQEFTAALEQDFEIEKIFTNASMAIALIRKAK